MTKKELMVKAHKMTKEIKNEYPNVDYKFQLGLCLAYLHQEGEKEMGIEEKLVEAGCKVWEKGEMRRIYINDVAVLCEKFGILTNAKRINKTVKMHYDCVTDTFSYSSNNSYKETVEELISAIRA